MDYKAIHEAALAAAICAAKTENTPLGPERTRGFACGFAWVEAPTVKLSSVAGKALKALGFDKMWGKKSGIYLWNPAKQPTQSVSVHLAGAIAYAKVFTDAGIPMHAGSRYD